MEGIVPWFHFRKSFREIRDRFKGTPFFRDHYVFGTKNCQNRDKFKVVNFLFHYSIKCRFDQMSFRSNVVSIKCRLDQVLFPSSVVLFKCHLIKCRSTKCRSIKCRLINCRVTKKYYIINETCYFTCLIYRPTIRPGLAGTVPV